MVASAGDDGAARRYRFTAAQRIRRPPEFKRVYADGFRLSNEFFTVTVRWNGLSFARLGMSVAARTMGHAVERNRVRRLIRESFRLNQHGLPAVDMVIGMRNLARGIDSARLRDRLEELWSKIVKRCASSSVSSSGPTSSA